MAVGPCTSPAENRRDAPEPAPPSADYLIERIEEQAAPAPVPDGAELDADAEVAVILGEMAQEPGCTFVPPAELFQDFTVRCRMRRVRASGLDVTAFRRRFAMALAGMADPADPRWTEVLALARGVPEDLLAPFLVLARAAIDGMACPDDEQLAQVYGTHSEGRIRRLLDNFERQGLIVMRTDFGGRRSVTLPHLGLTSAAVEA